MRVLFWAIVLLTMVVFAMGCVMRLTTGTIRDEFSTLTESMFTIFRCFTDGCSAYDGTPLQNHLYQVYGFPAMIIYTLVFLFVTIGIFNLIMAIFIEQVLASAGKRNREELGSRSEHMRLRIQHVLGTQFDADEEMDQGASGEKCSPGRDCRCGSRVSIFWTSSKR